MLKNCFILLAFSLFSWSLVAQCPGFSIVLETQAEVDAFATNYPGCTDLLQNLEIGDNGNPTDVSDLSALSVITSIAGEFDINNNPSLTSLDGLDNLTSVQFLRIRNNSTLTDLTALSSLTTIQNSLFVQDNAVLTSLEGLNNVDPIDLGFAQILDNPMLSTCAIESICGYIDNGNTVTAANNATGCNSNAEIETACAGPTCPEGTVFLTSQAQVDAFVATYPDCTMLEGGLVIGLGGASMNDISDVSGLSNIVSTGDNVQIENTQLTSLSGLEGLVTIGGPNQLFIGNNSMLTDISGIANVSGFTTLEITNNPLLSTCEVANVCTHVNDGGTSTISGNAAGCASLMEVEVACTPAPLCPEGTVFLTSQAQVDAFVATYPDCTMLEGGLVIGLGGASMNDISDVSGLSNIVSTGDNVQIENTQLTSLSGLEGLVTIGGPNQLFIGNNSMLTDISGIANVSGFTTLEITNNPLLSTCEVANVCTHVNDGGTSTISGNAAGCASLMEVEVACTPAPLCPEGDVTFLSQAEVDAFVAAYPNCTTIGGNLFIGPINSGTTGETTDITDISGLISITSVQGSLAIEGSPQLTSLQGVNAITTVGSSLVVRTMTGLSTIDELSSITTMNGFLAIDGNTLLTSIDGIENITPSGIGNLFIVANPQLSSCAIDNVCAYLGAMPTGITDISNNAAGCNSVVEVETACDMVGGGDCPEGNVTFTTQAEVDAFVAAYPNCDMISGNLRIGLGAGSTDISDLSGLNSITNVTGLLAFFYNDQLTSLTGLEALTRVGEGVYIYRNNSISSLAGLDNLSTIGGKLDIFRNDNMTSLMGLSSVVFVGGELRIRNNTSLATTEGLNALAEIGGYFAVQSNSSLENLDGLESLVTMNSFVSIRDNASLTNIEGMVNINPAGITKLHITDNSLLSECAIDNVCAFLATAGSPAQIANNAGKCSSRIGVEESCAATDMLVANTNEEDAATSEATKLTSIETSSIAASVKLFPNPTSGLVQIRNIEAQRVTIFNPQGQRMAQYNTPTTELDMSTLPAGVYYISFETAEGRQTERVVKVD